MDSDGDTVDPRLESRRRLRAMPVRITQQPIVAEGDVEGSGDVWILRMGGSRESCEAHALVGNEGSGVVVGTTLPVPEPADLPISWAWQYSGPRFLLGALTSPEVNALQIEMSDSSPVLLAPIHRHAEPAANFFLADFYKRALSVASSMDRDGAVLATEDISDIDTTGSALLARAEAARKRSARRD